MLRINVKLKQSRIAVDKYNIFISLQFLYGFFGIFKILITYLPIILLVIKNMNLTRDMALYCVHYIRSI